MSTRSWPSPALTSPPARPASAFSELRALVTLGLPMIGTQLAIMGMGFLDTAMAGHYDRVALAGVQLGGAVMWPVFMFMTGITMAITPIVSQYRGADRVADAGAVVRQGLWVALFAALVTMAVILAARPLLELFGVAADVIDVAEGYLAGAAWGMPPVMLYVVLRYTCEGLGHTGVPMGIAFAALALNAPLNYVLIYGRWGFPELGGAGCGWATAAVMWFEFVAMLAVLGRPWLRATGLLARFDAPRPREMLRILRVGLPIGITIFLEMALFSVLSLLIGGMSVVALAAHSVAGNLNWMVFVIPMGLGSAASIRVGYHVGAGDYAASRRVALTAIGVCLAYALLVSVLLVAARWHLVALYTADPEVTAVAGTLLLFIAVYQIVDDSQATLAGVLRGYKDTFWPMLFSLVGYWLLALPFGAALAYGVWGLPELGLYGYWAGITLGLAVVAICMAMRLWVTAGSDGRIRRLALA